MINLDSVSTETFQILRSFDLTLAMYDDEGNVVSEPEEARRMFATPMNLLVSVVDDNDNSTVRLYLSANTHLKKDAKVRRLIQSLRNCASKYNMMFKVRKHSKELKPKDFSTRTSVTEGKTNMDLTEGLYGTSRSSYLALENARMIIRHKAKINEEIAGARSRMIESILIENSSGERFLMPTPQLAPARAMTQHVNQGGSFADEVGGHILRMGQAFSDLGQASHFIGVNNAVLPEGAMPIREKCMGKRKSMRRSFARLAKESTYSDECNVLKETFGAEPLVEAAVLENLRNLLTVEGKEIKESVLQTVAAYIHEGEDRMLDEEEAPVAGGDTVRVLGYDIDRSVMMGLMQGKLELGAPMARSADMNPDFKTKTAEIMFKVGHLAPVVRDHSMSLLLADVPEKFQTETNPDKRRAMLKLALTALQAANVKITEEFGARGIDAILEHEAWFKQFDPNKVLFEAAEADEDDCDDEDCDVVEESAEDCDEEDCDLEEALEEAFDEEELSTRNEDREDDELEEGILDRFSSSGPFRRRPVNVGGIKYMLTTEANIIVRIEQDGPEGKRNVPLDHPMAERISRAAGLKLDSLNEDFEDTDLDADAFAGGPDVEANIADEEFVEEECDPVANNVGLDDDLIESEFANCDSDDCEVVEEELAREDVLLPKEQGLDLAREVSAHDEEDDVDLQEGFASDVARIIELSRILK